MTPIDAYDERDELLAFSADYAQDYETWEEMQDEEADQGMYE